MKRMALSLLIVLVLCGTALGSESEVKRLSAAMLTDANAMAREGDIGKSAHDRFAMVVGIAIEVGRRKDLFTTEEVMKLRCFGAALGAWLEMGGRTAHSKLIMPLTLKCVEDGGYDRGLK